MSDEQMPDPIAGATPQPPPPPNPYVAPAPAQPSNPYAAPAQAGYPPQPGTPMPYGHPAANLRPGTVTGAAIITWILSGLMALMGLVMSLAFFAGSGAMLDTIMDGIRSETPQGEIAITEDQLQVGIVAVGVIGLLIVALSLAAMVAAAMAWRGSRGGRIALIVLSSIATLMSLPMALSGVSLLWTAGAIAVIVMLSVRSTKDWYASFPR